MSSLQQSDELVFHEIPDELVFHEIPSSKSFQRLETNQQDLIVDLRDHVTMEANTNLPASKARKRHGDQSSSNPNSATADVGDSKDELTQRKLVRREIEKQRRQDMAKLYASITDLLPLEFVKGKRSISDHMHESVNYIKHMQENIKVLSVKRDQLKKLMDLSVPAALGNTNESLMNLHPNTVSISSCNEGVDILINSCRIEDGFPLARVLKALDEEGLNVMTCASTKVNRRLIHSIQSESSDPAWTNFSTLQQRLTAIANNQLNFD